MPMPGLILHFQAVCACRQQYGCGGIDITDGQKLVEDAKGSFRRMSSPAFFERKLAGEVNVLICLGVQRVIRSETWNSPSFGAARVRAWVDHIRKVISYTQDSLGASTRACQVLDGILSDL